MTANVARPSKKAVLTILLGFMAWGFSFLCRTSLQYLRPDLSSSQLGTVNLVMVICVFLSAILFTRFADKKNKHVFVMFLSLLICAVGQVLTSLTASFGFLIFTRCIVGLGAGPIFALACSVCSKTCTPKQFALACGIVCDGEGFISSFVGPSLIVALLAGMSWQMAGWLLAIPVVIVAVLYLLFVRNLKSGISVEEVDVPDTAQAEVVAQAQRKKSGFGVVFKNRNALLCLCMGVLSMVGLWSVLLYAPDYWMSVVGLSDVDMGFLMSGMGIAYVVWNIVLSVLSDHIGRRWTCGIFSLLNVVCLFVMFIAPTSGINPILFIVFSGLPSALSMFFFAAIPMESVGEQDAATAGGIINGASDLVGAALVPFILGLVADSAGLPTIYLIAAICMAATVALSFCLKETAPRVLERRAKACK